MNSGRTISMVSQKEISPFIQSQVFLDQINFFLKVLGRATGTYSMG